MIIKTYRATSATDKVICLTEELPQSTSKVIFEDEGDALFHALRDSLPWKTYHRLYARMHADLKNEKVELCGREKVYVTFGGTERIYEARNRNGVRLISSHNQGAVVQWLTDHGYEALV